MDLFVCDAHIHQLALHRLILFLLYSCLLATIEYLKNQTYNNTKLN